MKVIVLAVKGIKESFRDIKNIAFLLAFPLMFLVLFRVAFGFGTEATATYDILILDEDDGEGPWDQMDPQWLPLYNSAMGTDYTGSEFFHNVILEGKTDTAGEYFVDEVLRTATYEGNEKKMFNIKMVSSREEGEDIVSKGNAALLVVIPANYSSAVQGVVDQAIVDEVRAHSVSMNASSDQYAHTKLELTGELGNFDFSFASSLVSGQLMQYLAVLEGTVRYAVGSTFPDGPATQEGGSVAVVFVSIGETDEFTLFDWQAPGIIIFALMMTAIYVTATLATEVKNKTLQRLRLTKMTSFDMMGGTTLRWLFIGTFQLIIMLVVIWALGVNFAGTFGPTFGAIFIISLVAILASISLGLIISAFVDDPEQAGNIGTAIVVPMSFLTGAFFPMDVAAAQLLPWTQASLALKQVMLYADWEVAATHTLYAFVAAMVVFVIGVILFQRKRLRA